MSQRFFFLGKGCVIILFLMFTFFKIKIRVCIASGLIDFELSCYIEL